MKIGRSTGIGNTSQSEKALLIGITYGAGDAGTSYGELKGPHADVAAMRALLVARYNYAESDIVVLLDEKDAAVQPTRANILHAIDELVRGARKGDRFFFHYCGHTTQVENRSNSEEDGMDECLVPVDGEANKIVDNELRRHLVAALPVGSSLVAVFDSCHSASLLDLAHFRCNRVYVPWLSKGRRRSDERWNAVVRQLALPLLPLSKSKPQTPAHSPTRSRSNSVRSPPLSRSNTHASATRSPLGSTPLPPLQAAATTIDKLLRRAVPARKATRRATREIRELLQLLENVPVPAAEQAAAWVPPVEEGPASLEPTRPNTPLAASSARGSPLVTTRRIYEAARTSHGGLRAWRTEVDALEVGYSDRLAEGDGADVGVREVKGDEMKPLGRAGTEGDLRARGGRGKQKRQPGESKERTPRKRTSLPLVPLRLGSLGVGQRGEQVQEEPVAMDRDAKGKGNERRTAVKRARAVSVAVREDSGGPSSGAGKENVAGVRRPTLAIAVPKEQARPASWLGEEGEERACESPAPVWPCTGWACRDPAHQHDEEVKASVISLASCKDHQLSWETADGGSMTKELVRILERDPHPTLRSLITSVSHALHGMSLERHLETRRYKRDVKKYAAFLERQRANAALLRPSSSSSATPRSPTQDSSRVSTLSPSTPGAPISRSSSRAAAATGIFPNEDTRADTSTAVRKPMAPQAKAKSEGFVSEYDMDNFQDPQVSSHQPLDMEQPWCM
ncbi:caspase domain-containing protein [Mycena olivaceomarginata]|nr:caspase domain-containing protein [Mycena olivaceomarginata]